MHQETGEKHAWPRATRWSIVGAGCTGLSSAGGLVGAAHIPEHAARIVLLLVAPLVYVLIAWGVLMTLTLSGPIRRRLLRAIDADLRPLASSGRALRGGPRQRGGARRL
jgi:hypothetical protein